MIFLFIMPTLISYAGNWLVPQTYNAYDFATPRVNVGSLWLLIASLLVTFNAGLREEGVSGGWTLYVPLNDGTYSSSTSTTVFIFVIHLLGLSSQGGSLTFLTSIMLSRSHGLSTGTQTLFTWCILTVSVLLVSTLPVLGAGATTILTDRVSNTSVLNSTVGGDPVLFQHMFWFFGHPEVYVIILPAFGILSWSISLSSIQGSFGNASMLWAILSIAFIGYFVWAHHMFTTGMSTDSRVYFSSATAIIAVPTAVKIYSWVLSLHASKFRESSVIRSAFLICFTLGGFTGLILSNSSVDMCYHDTYYVVAHFHYVLSIGALFGSILVIRMLLESILITMISSNYARFTDVLLVFGVNLLFLLLHELGRDGHPRRIPVSSEVSLLSGQLANTGITGVLLSSSILFCVGTGYCREQYPVNVICYRVNRSHLLG